MPRSPRNLVATLLSLALVGAFPANAAGAEVVKDGSFESTAAADDNPNWDEGWLVFPPICDSTCLEGGQGGGTVGPRTGTNWVWFGGSRTPEEQFVSQEVTIPNGPAILTFYLWLGVSSGNGVDAVRVFIDGQEVFEVFEGDDGYGTYTKVTVDVSKYVSDRPHDLRFEFMSIGPQPTNFSLDDISLTTGSVATEAKTVTLSGRKAVKKGGKAKLTARVTPCTGHEGDAVELMRNGKLITIANSDATCTAVFKVKVKRTARYHAVSPQQDEDHLAGSSKKIKVKARRVRR